MIIKTTCTEWALCSWAITWYKIVKLASKWRTGTCSTKKIESWWLCLTCPSASFCTTWSLSCKGLIWWPKQLPHLIWIFPVLLRCWSPALGESRMYTQTVQDLLHFPDFDSVHLPHVKGKCARTGKLGKRKFWALGRTYHISYSVISHSSLDLDYYHTLKRWLSWAGQNEWIMQLQSKQRQAKLVINCVNKLQN